MNIEPVRVTTVDVNIALIPAYSDGGVLAGYQIIRDANQEIRELREIRDAAQKTVDFGFSQYYQDKLRALLERREQYVKDTGALLERKESK